MSEKLLSEELRVFVYGTLKPGECNFDRYCQGNVIASQSAIAYGTLFYLPARGYPGMTIGNSPVYGYLLTFNNPDILTKLDELEDYDGDRPAHKNEYTRQEIETFSLDFQPLGTAWVYLMELEQTKRFGGILLPLGNWTEADWLGGRAENES